jgi:sterol desaturase/sphingolipid hydroxylase (fatty acid hydroxylase superfamily)
VKDIVSEAPKEKPVPLPKLSPFADYNSHLGAMAASVRSWVVAYIAMYVLFEGDSYPAFGSGKTFEWDWMSRILIRNMLTTWVVCCAWDWLLYFSPFKHKLNPYKYNPEYPPFDQIKHDAFYTTLSSFFGSCIEILLCHWWAIGAIPMQRSLSEAPLTNIIVAITITHWRMIHFTLMHRGMHPWKTTQIPDLGKFLYRHVHSLHHKSYNPTAFSGTSMHPVESILYYTVGIIPIAFGLHPIHALAAMIECAIAAWLGHDGFQYPGYCDYYHYLHHKHFECNYGGPHLPFDWYWGTYAGNDEDVKKLGSRKRLH